MHVAPCVNLTTAHSVEPGRLWRLVISPRPGLCVRECWPSTKCP